MIQAMSGLMSITGFPDNGPTRVGFAGADVMSGATAALGVASALYQRTHTGKGQLVDVAMIDAVMGYLAQQFTEHLMTGRVHEQAQNLSVTRKPTGNLFKTKDGWMVLAVMTEPQFQRLMKVLGRADALADPRFVDWPTRIANNKALHEIVEQAMKQRDLGDLGRALRQGRRAGRPRAQHSRDGASSTTSRTAPSCRRSRPSTARSRSWARASGWSMAAARSSARRPSSASTPTRCCARRATLTPRSPRCATGSRVTVLPNAAALGQ